MAVVARPVDRVPAAHKDYGLGTVEHVQVADWAVAVSGALNMFVGLRHFHVHAEAACLATTIQLASNLERLGTKGGRELTLQ